MSDADDWPAIRRSLTICQAQLGRLEKINSELQGALNAANERIEALNEQARALKSGTAMAALVEENAALADQNMTLRQRLRDADAGERLRNKRESEASKRAAPIAMLEGVTYGSGQVRRVAIAEGAYWVAPHRRMG